MPARSSDLIELQLPINDPFFHKDAMQSPDSKVIDFASKVKGAEIVVFRAPLYHGSFFWTFEDCLRQPR